jgi:hypothetical protein
VRYICEGSGNELSAQGVRVGQYVWYVWPAEPDKDCPRCFFLGVGTSEGFRQGLSQHRLEGQQQVQGGQLGPVSVAQKNME